MIERLEDAAPSQGWLVGWGLGAAVVAVAASLLLTVIGLGRRIVRQADEITAALDGARRNTAALFAVGRTNAALERTESGLRDLRLRRDGR